MTIREAEQQTLLQLKKLYDDRESSNICDWVLEYLTGKRRIDRILFKDTVLSNKQLEELGNIREQLGAGKPVQYVLNEAWFGGMKLFVNQFTLIPRPETEELAEWIITESKDDPVGHLSILDIGTGSGCIPVYLKKKMPGAVLSAIDTSDQALIVAKKNAEIHGVPIDFKQLDFLKEPGWQQLQTFDIIVSNPPYIRQSEENTMARNVLDHEPLLALFVPDNDALLFYRKIAAFGKTHLSEKGKIYLEINEALGKDVLQLFEREGYYAELKKDLQGKDRMVKAWGHRP